MSDQYEYFDLVCRVVAEYLEMDVSELQGATQLDADLGLDSTELVCVVVDLERELGFSLKGIPFGQLKTLADMAVAVDQLEGEVAMA